MLVLLADSPSARLPLPPSLSLLTNFFHAFPKNFLHLWKFPVISHLRTNFTEMPGNRSYQGTARANQGRRGGESESPEEEAIEIGNSYRIH